MKTTYKGVRALTVAIHLLSSVALATSSTQALAKEMKLPPPAVSRALDAILLPIDAAVAKEFELGAERKGVLVLAVQPGGVADKQGIKPGDVLTEILGRSVRKPIDVDIAVSRGLKAGKTSYAFDVDRGGTVLAVATVITLALYDETFSVSEISSWESWSETTSFSYSEFVSEYSETIEASYESEEATIEKSISDEEGVEKTATDDDADDDGTPDANDSDDDNDGTPDDADTDDDNDGVDDSAEDDEAADDGAAEDDGGDADGGDADDAGADDGGDDSGGDDGGDDSGGDDGGGDSGGGDDGGE